MTIQWKNIVQTSDIQCSTWSVQFRGISWPTSPYQRRHATRVIPKDPKSNKDGRSKTTNTAIYIYVFHLILYVYSLYLIAMLFNIYGLWFTKIVVFMSWNTYCTWSKAIGWSAFFGRYVATSPVPRGCRYVLTHPHIVVHLRPPARYMVYFFATVRVSTIPPCMSRKSRSWQGGALIL